MFAAKKQFRRACNAVQEKQYMINTIKSLSCLGMLTASAWFLMEPDFAAVLAGIFSLMVFLMTFLPNPVDKQA